MLKCVLQSMIDKTQTTECLPAGNYYTLPFDGEK